ncbi:hypothetical protein Aut01nite_46600 [Actinoplanes utahensis]|nr:hypothetical protein Aut01nite_46600 [Actinoplanes utahensis]
MVSGSDIGSNPSNGSRSSEPIPAAAGEADSVSPEDMHADDGPRNPVAFAGPAAAASRGGIRASGSAVAVTKSRWWWLPQALRPHHIGRHIRSSNGTNVSAVGSLCAIRGKPGDVATGESGAGLDLSSRVGGQSIDTVYALGCGSCCRVRNYTDGHGIRLRLRPSACEDTTDDGMRPGQRPSTETTRAKTVCAPANGPYQETTRPETACAASARGRSPNRDDAIGAVADGRRGTAGGEVVGRVATCPGSVAEGLWLASFGDMVRRFVTAGRAGCGQGSMNECGGCGIMVSVSLGVFSDRVREGHRAMVAVISVMGFGFHESRTGFRWRVIRGHNRA